jgi:RNA polymerase sigma-70 factor (ECF subfamily)
VTEIDEAHEEAQVLLVRLADDLDAGFGDLMRAYQQVVYSVALRTSGQPFDAEDLAAEAFLRAYRALRGYDRERILALRPRAWLLTIVLNTWRNWVRDLSRRPRQIPLRDHADPPVGGLSVEEMTEHHEALYELSGLVGRLPDPQRVAVVLRHVVGLPIAEVAVVMGCPQGTAKSHVSRGLQRLRTLYQAPSAADIVSQESVSLPDANSNRNATTLPVSITNTPPSPATRGEQL